jgi:hypothetical protein
MIIENSINWLTLLTAHCVLNARIMVNWYTETECFFVRKYGGLRLVTSSWYQADHGIALHQ